MILLVIISNNILLDLPIIFIYHFVLDSLSFQYTKSHLFIIENCFFYIILLKNALAIILFIEKHTIYYYILLRSASIFFLFFLLLFYNY